MRSGLHFADVGDFYAAIFGHRVLQHEFTRGLGGHATEAELEDIAIAHHGLRVGARDQEREERQKEEKEFHEVGWGSNQ